MYRSMSEREASNAYPANSEVTSRNRLANCRAAFVVVASISSNTTHPIKILFKTAADRHPLALLEETGKSCRYPGKFAGDAKLIWPRSGNAFKVAILIIARQRVIDPRGRFGRVGIGWQPLTPLRIAERIGHRWKVASGLGISFRWIRHVRHVAFRVILHFARRIISHELILPSIVIATLAGAPFVSLGAEN
jgi:hypothetical protein